MSSRSQLSLLALLFLDLCGFGMLLPDVQLRAESLGAPGWLIGAILSSTFLVQTATSARCGAIADRRGRKRIMLLCTGLSAASMFAYTQSSTVWVILGSRILAGFGGANVAIAQACLAGTVKPEERTAILGKAAAAISAGLIAGASLGGVVSQFGGRVLLGAVAGSLSALGIIAAALYVPEVAAPAETGGKTREAGLLRGRPVLIRLVVAASVAWFSLACLEGTFGRLIRRQLGYGVLVFGLIFAYESLLSVIVQSLLVQPLAKRFGERRLLVGAFLFQGAGLVLMPFAGNLAVLVVGATIYSIGSGLAGPAINGWSSREVPDRLHGSLFGLLQSARSIGFIVGPTIGGALFDRSPYVPYVVAGVASASAAILVGTMPSVAESKARA